MTSNSLLIVKPPRTLTVTLTIHVPEDARSDGELQAEILRQLSLSAVLASLAPAIHIGIRPTGG